VPSEKGAPCSPTCARLRRLAQPQETAAVRLTGLHGRTDGPAGEKLYGADKGVTDKTYEEVQWPAVTRHPVSGRSILFVNPLHTHGSSA